MHAEIQNGRIILFDSYLYKESVKEISGRRWHPESKTWSVPLNVDSMETLRIIGCAFSEEMVALEKQFFKKASKSIVELLPAPLKVTPYAHQLEGYNLACRNMGIIGGVGLSPGYALLMEMGTGKTHFHRNYRQSILNGQIKRLLILAPKSIVAVWEDEFAKFADFPIP